MPLLQWKTSEAFCCYTRLLIWFLSFSVQVLTSFWSCELQVASIAQIPVTYQKGKFLIPVKDDQGFASLFWLVLLPVV